MLWTHPPGPGRRSAPRIGRRILTASTGAAALALGGCEADVLTAAGPVGRADAQILINSLAIMLAIVIPTIIACIAFAWWFRASNTKARYRPDFVYSGRIELVVWAIPLLTITFLGGLIWIGSHELDPGKPLPSKTRPLEVQVVSLDWKWLFIYPDQQIASVNQLVVPAGAPVHFSLTSASVMNSFFVPKLGSMIYTMNGMATSLNLQADRPGVYPGLATHFSGDGFSDMHFDVRAVPAQEFAAWSAGVRAAGPVLDRAGYAQLARQSTKVAPFTYRAAEPGLFQAIVDQTIPSADGPDTSRPNHTVFPKPLQPGPVARLDPGESRRAMTSKPLER